MKINKVNYSIFILNMIIVINGLTAQTYSALMAIAGTAIALIIAVDELQ